MAFSSKKSFNVSASALSSSIIKILFRIVLYREIYDKFCSDTKFTLHFYLRIMSFYQGLHIRKPEPEAGFVPYRLIFAAVEFLKNPGQIFFGDAQPIIFHTYFQLILFIGNVDVDLYPIFP